MELLETCNEEGFVFVPSESGVGPSDHTSFYLQDIPVLHFFTGQHPDYHKPSDTADKINNDGILRIVNFVERLINLLNAQEDWVFTATKDQDEESTPSFKVTLGVIPDYLFSGEGMRIDGVSENRPAALAGLIRGDIVTQIDTVNVTDMMSYMKALSLFQPGNESKVTVERGGQLEQVTVLWD
jgi:membrane-associated protease RseP (regulator of RpoE activity)